MSASSCNRHMPARTRREFLERSSFGFGSLALSYLLGRDAMSAASRSEAVNPLSATPQHFPGRAKNVIFLFMQGGPSHVDTFDPKPVLNRLDGQFLPTSFQRQDLALAQINAKESKLMGSRRQFKKYGKSGLEISDLFCNVAAYADDIAVIRSCFHESFIHGPALGMLHTGSLRPAIRAWARGF